MSFFLRTPGEVIAFVCEPKPPLGDDEINSPWDMICRDYKIRWWWGIEGNVHKYKPEYYVPIETRSETPDSVGRYRYY